MTMPIEALLLCAAVITLAGARALAPQAPDARDGELETPQHREDATPPAIIGAEGARFLDDLTESGALTHEEAHEMRPAEPDFSHLIALLALAGAVWLILTGFAV